MVSRVIVCEEDDKDDQRAGSEGEVRKSYEKICSDGVVCKRLVLMQLLRFSEFL